MVKKKVSQLKSRAKKEEELKVFMCLDCGRYTIDVNPATSCINCGKDRIVICKNFEVPKWR